MKSRDIAWLSEKVIRCDRVGTITTRLVLYPVSGSSLPNVTNDDRTLLAKVTTNHRENGLGWRLSPAKQQKQGNYVRLSTGLEK